MEQHRETPPAGKASVLLSSAGRNWAEMQAEFLRIPRGRHHVPGDSMHRLGIHFGRPVNADGRVDGRRSRRLQKPGDIDIIPAGLDGSWEDDGDCTILRLRLEHAMVRRAAEDLGRDPDKIDLQPTLQLRDSRIEALASAIKADLEADIPSDPLYAQWLGMALALRLLDVKGGLYAIDRYILSTQQNHLLADYIETHLDRDLSLFELASIAGIGISQLKVLFPKSFGMPVHQYVVRRRVEQARSLLQASEMPMSEVALAVGFAHQSHMATWMRRLLGVRPSEIRRKML
jgi:AraC family transcriptional regulator